MCPQNSPWCPLSKNRRWPGRAKHLSGVVLNLRVHDVPYREFLVKRAVKNRATSAVLPGAGDRTAPSGGVHAKRSFLPRLQFVPAVNAGPFAPSSWLSVPM